MQTAKSAADVYIQQGDAITEWADYLEHDGSPIPANSGPGGLAPGFVWWQGTLNPSAMPPDLASLAGLPALTVASILAEADVQRYGIGAGRPPVPNQPSFRYSCAGGTDEDKIFVPGMVHHTGGFGGYFDALPDGYVWTLQDFRDMLKCRQGNRRAGNPTGAPITVSTSAQEWIDFCASGWAQWGSFASFVTAATSAAGVYVSPFVLSDGTWHPRQLSAPVSDPGKSSAELAAQDLADAKAEALTYAALNTAPQAVHPGTPNVLDQALPLGLHTAPPYIPQPQNLSGRWRDATGAGIIVWRREDDANGVIASGAGFWGPGVHKPLVSVLVDDAGKLWIGGLTPAAITLVLTDIASGAVKSWQVQGKTGFLLVDGVVVVA